MGVALSVRLLAGPYSIAGVPVNTALNPAGVFGLAVTLLFVTAPVEAGAAAGSARRKLGAFAAIAALSAAAFAPALNIGFLSDDFILVDLASQWSPGALARDFRTAGGDGFFRPLGFVSLAIDHAWAGREPMLWHAAAMALHIVNALLAAWVAMRLGAGSLAAFLAGALFAVHGGRPEAAVWIAARFDLLATGLALVAILLYEKQRDAWAVGAFVTAALCKESVYVLPAVLLCLAFYWKRPWRSTIPFFAAAAVLFAYRWILFGGIGGYVAGGASQALSVNASTVKALLVRLWTGLYLPVNWFAEPAWWLAGLGVAYLVALFYLGICTRPSRPLWPMLAALVVAILPPLHLLSVSETLEGQRLFYFPSVLFCLLLAMAMDGVGARAQAAIGAAVIAFHIGALGHNIEYWRVVSQRVDETCATAATYPAVHVAGLPRLIMGVPAFANGFPECVAFAAGHDVPVYLNGDPPPDAVHLVWDEETATVRRASP